MKNMRIEGRKWFDKVNGNTYHSARVYVDGVLVATCPFQYGYGDQYVWSGWEAVIKTLNLDVKQYSNGSQDPAWQWCRDNGVAFTYDAVNVLKRDCKAFGQ